MTTEQMHVIAKITDARTFERQLEQTVEEAAELNRELGRMEQERKDNESKAYHNRRKRNPSKG